MIKILEMFAVKLRSRGLSYLTVRDYYTTMKRFTKWAEQINGKLDPEIVTPLDVADYRRYLQSLNKKPATVNHSLDVISSFFSWATSEGITQTNPAAGVKRIIEKRAAPKWLTRQQIGTLIRVVQKFGIVSNYAYRT